MSKTTLSIRDFAILYNIVHREINEIQNAYECRWNWTDEAIEKSRKEHLESLQQNERYQNLLRIRDKLGELNIEIDTPDVEIKE
jgi:hypothetical protein